MISTENFFSGLMMTIRLVMICAVGIGALCSVGVLTSVIDMTTATNIFGLFVLLIFSCGVSTSFIMSIKDEYFRNPAYPYPYLDLSNILNVRSYCYDYKFFPFPIIPLMPNEFSDSERSCNNVKRI